MKRLVLLRHGESEWNRENRFTGWTNVGLTNKGIEEAKEAGRLLKEKGFSFDMAFTSYLNRAIKTLWLALEEMDQMWIPVQKSWRLNEKHYGLLQGLNKAETAEKYGEEQVLLWRRSFDVPPSPIPENDPRHPRFDPRYKELSTNEIPATESLKDTIERMIPYWENNIKPALQKNSQILVAAHGNSLRAVVKYLKNMSEEDIIKFNIPTGIPYVFDFDEDLNLQKDEFIGDPETIKKLMDAVANQAKTK
ncbi:MAG TPA: 2,3-diphosphoglycerate-dependent phosphoglycerate mutase [Bacteroidales bacterium]|nr:2,3-diphosphoglycerate-dependent phosphoglycerate mutase [Bacteroidales bacterium]